MATQHDKIFKQLLRVFLEDFLRLVAPQALERLDLSSPELLDKELFAGGPHGRRRELDLLARVSAREGRPLLIHVEIEARASPCQLAANFPPQLYAKSPPLWVSPALP